MIRRPFTPQPFKQCPSIWNHGNPAPAFPPFVPVTASPRTTISLASKSRSRHSQRVRLALAHPAVGQTFHEISAITREAAVPVAHLRNHRVELVAARQRNLFRRNARVLPRPQDCVDHARFNCHRKHMPEQGNGVVVIARRRNPAYLPAHALQSPGVILRISVVERSGQLFSSARRRSR